ncbi:hypothetical protein A2331_06115 [Candidatus Falkowbacteria bacterium RIFOXYB2_FULL_34_18]|uniref:Glycosyltransferase 2-like domain-containing protein n=1 Tax=Candidatus Falkowbacteria bacterium RIFOXYD2_FULL_34_120 TaxID=1798007 RepID=A0A1F5TNN4_9BACT|nr:MAG: hypothetical protein A2331_06115 [Candidatus Falkowbacteria bacterium RIFOXYB2_FULL_34_18]OGF28983.1 MAG: hypothetical protein A2500_01810 [Candidatus Falkowbacteria bacterium RIFOXYC12_FULL_34_55]OGF35897.1 MAG: hypothetical protein A2466_02330 [Candidatus Falkowbacteria bacterium RIFOXYC2_FULL_34_220]OGF38494.1 MAG: hypothetical protein A2515_03115 [Candidatus Falkowbacteria bacterium RIFOXYD12_FULL_34_57]OGF40573.1 MAG: hypothetical protein A2531_03520 [Candidatus Falkowbacteria bact
MSSFNKGSFVKEAIESVVCQTFSDWELIIIDDASTDNSVDVIRPFLKDKRIKLFINQKNIGPINVQKMMMEKASADIVGILDSDDVLNKDAIQEILKVYREDEKIGMVYSQAAYCDENLKYKHLGYAGEVEPKKSNLHHNMISHFRTFKKDAYFKTAGYNKECLFAEDADILLKLEEVCKIVFLNKVLYYYRILPDSQIHGFQNEMKNRSSTALARLNAYQRRLGTNIPNLSRVEISEVLFFGIFSSVFCGRYKRALYFSGQILKIYLIFFLDPRFYYLVVKKLTKNIILKILSR